MLSLAIVSVNPHVAFPRLLVVSGSIRLILCRHLQARGRTPSFLKKLLAEGNAEFLGASFASARVVLEPANYRTKALEGVQGRRGVTEEWMGSAGSGVTREQSQEVGLGCWRLIGVIEEKTVSPCLDTWVSSWLC